MLLLFVVARTNAHVPNEAEPAISTNNIAIALVIVAFLAMFTIGWLRMPPRRSGKRPVSAWRASLFVSGVCLLAIALLPPFDDFADRYFSAHMAQHLVLLVIAPPMLAVSQAHLVLLHALPLNLRRRIGGFVARMPGLRFAAHDSSTVWFACLSSIAILWFWHFPAVYDWARENETVHDAEHLLFLSTELAFWRVIFFRRERELSRAGAALILVGMSVQGGLLAALITFAGRPLYLSYGSDSAALADQALGGVMMWVICGTVYLGAFVVLFGRALARVPRRPSKVAGFIESAVTITSS